MNLDQLHDLKVWHQLHRRDHPREKDLWDLVLTFWVVGWVGAPVASVVHVGWAIVLCVALVFLPGGYVALRRALHRAGWVRCDWLGTLRR